LISLVDKALVEINTSGEKHGALDWLNDVFEELAKRDDLAACGESRRVPPLDFVLRYVGR
jgi:hypothetical protein